MPDTPQLDGAADARISLVPLDRPGAELTARVTDTFLRGQAVVSEGRVVGEPRGQYLHRPTSRS